MMTKPADPGLHGWLVIDKPEAITSARVVSQIKRATGAKVGHAGTLDPLATGILPLALGEATKTVPFLVDADKSYRFTVEWGRCTASFDREGSTTAQSVVRPSSAAVEAALPAVIVVIVHVRP